MKSAHHDSLCSRFAGDNFSKINSSLPTNAGWNTRCAMVSQARWSIDTSIVSQNMVRLIQCQCKSRLQSGNLGIKKRIFNQIITVWPCCLPPPSCPDTEAVPQLIKSVWLVEIPEVPLAAYEHQNKATLMKQNGLKYDNKSAKQQQHRAPAIL